METDTSWISGLVGDNLLAVLDVALDVNQQSQFPGDVLIDLLPSVVRFRQLMPIDGANFRDRYCELRWNAASLLKKHGSLTAVEVVRRNHRWESKLRVIPTMDLFRPTYAALQAEYDARTREPTEDHEIESSPGATDNLRNIALRLHSVVVQLRQRHNHRQTLDVSDEYDVQDLLHALLRLYFDDIRPEEWTPSYAGKSSRVDFLLKPERIVVEVKKTRPGLGAKEVGDQLIIDIERYSKMTDCQSLFCLVYDPDSRIANPGGFQADLSGARGEMAVEVMVVPKQY